MGRSCTDESEGESRNWIRSLPKSPQLGLMKPVPCLEVLGLSPSVFGISDSNSAVSSFIPCMASGRKSSVLKIAADMP